MTSKKLTGQIIHEAFNATSLWPSLPQKIRDNYEEIAVALNEQLGLCCSCGERPEPTKLHEVAGEMLCSACLEPTSMVREKFHYKLGYGSGNWEWIYAANLKELYEHIQKYTILDRRFYVIVINRDREMVGCGDYTHTASGTTIHEESGQAVGLNGELYAIAFNNA